jgi:hypothetical protein
LHIIVEIHPSFEIFGGAKQSAVKDGIREFLTPADSEVVMGELALLFAGDDAARFFSRFGFFGGGV